jgi:hypothetical protein
VPFIVALTLLRLSRQDRAPPAGLPIPYLMCGFQESPMVFGWMKTIGRRRPNSGDAIASDGFSPWRLRLTIWRGAQAPHGRRTSVPADCKFVGRWRIVEADVS